MWVRSWLTGLCAAGLMTAASIDTRVADAAMQGNRDVVRALIKEKADVNAAQGDGATALHWAAFKDDLEMARMLLAAGANVKAATREGSITPLFMACTNGDAVMIEALLKAGADANSVKANGTTALMVASASGSPEAVKILLDHGAKINETESVHGQTALMFAAALNRGAVIRLLASRGADLNLATKVTKVERVRFDQDGNIVEDRPAGGRGGANPAAGVSPGQADLDTFAAALGFSGAEYKVDMLPGARDVVDTLAHAMGFRSAEFKMAKAKARAGDVAARAPRRVGPEYTGGMTAMLYAAREGQMDAIRALADAKADLNLSNADKYSPMVEAIMNGHFDAGKYLLDAGADPNVAAVTGLTALYAVIDIQWAPKAWYPEPSVEQEKVTYMDLMKDLVDHKANVNAAISDKLWFRSFTNDFTWIDPAGATPFWRAAQSSDVAAMHFLVEHGADPKTPTKGGATPLHAAAGIGWAANWSVNAPGPKIDAVKYALDLGNDVNAVENRGYTPLHGAAYLGDNEMIQYLISKGGNVKVKSKAGDTVADMANGPTRFGQPHYETVALLEKLGSANSHNCRSDQCVVAARSAVYQLTPEDLIQKEGLDFFAGSLGMKGVEYRPDVPAGGRFGFGGGGGGGRNRGDAEPAAPIAKPPEADAKAGEKKGPGSDFE
jgi:uncharacterized protein